MGFVFYTRKLRIRKVEEFAQGHTQKRLQYFEGQSSENGRYCSLLWRAYSYRGISSFPQDCDRLPLCIHSSGRPGAKAEMYFPFRQEGTFISLRAQLRNLGPRNTWEREQLRLRKAALPCPRSADSTGVIQMGSLLSSPMAFLATRHQHLPLPQPWLRKTNSKGKPSRSAGRWLQLQLEGKC